MTRVRASRRYQFRLKIGRLAGSELDHPVDQVDAEHLLGDAVLDLQPGVHFEEVELAARLS
jgi:hypothetical protein